jgi:hypothetical protein
MKYVVLELIVGVCAVAALNVWPTSSSLLLPPQEMRPQSSVPVPTRKITGGERCCSQIGLGRWHPGAASVCKKGERFGYAQKLRWRVF